MNPGHRFLDDGNLYDRGVELTRDVNYCSKCKSPGTNTPYGCMIGHNESTIISPLGDLRVDNNRLQSHPLRMKMNPFRDSRWQNFPIFAKKTLKKNPVHIGLVQMSCTASIEDNRAKASARIREAASQGAQIICLQELYSSLYFCDTENYDNFSHSRKHSGEHNN